ncbi:MAG: HAMP domain-containing protein [Symploca sp. SIO2G7]|nr:HAMP domain-containing protein [Symploca sp. SIO2G7]
MTAQQYSSDRQPQVPEAKTTPTKPTLSLGRTLSRGDSFSRRLIKTLLPTALLPVLVTSGLSILVTRQIEQQSTVSVLKDKSFLASEAAAIFIENSFKVFDSVRLNPLIVESLRQANEQVAQDDLANKPIETLEQQFEQTKLLSPNASINTFLANLVEAEELGEIFFTERNGLNVAYSNPTSDFVQRDEEWWIQGKERGQYIEPVEFDESANLVGVPLSQAIRPSDSDSFLGVMKIFVPLNNLNNQIATFVTRTIRGTQRIQVIDSRNGIAFATITADSVIADDPTVTGGEVIAQVAQTLSTQAIQNIEDTSALEQALAQSNSSVNLIQTEFLKTQAGQDILSTLVDYAGNRYSLTTVPGTSWVAISSISLAEINSAGRRLMITFALTAAVLGGVVILLSRVFASQLTAPLQALTTTAQKAASGDLDIRARLQGTLETHILGQTFNGLLEQIQTLLTRQKELTQEQRQEREDLENDITQLMEEVGNASEGDLSVRAKLVAGDVGIVADLFNAIIENLRSIAVTVRQSSGNVSQSLLTNEQQIRALAEQAIEEVHSLQSAMAAVEDMGQSIQSVANSASQVSTLTNETYFTAQMGSQSMGETTESILELRSTVGETAKKIKRLGESAQKIAQAVSLIDEIALKTNLLAVNASVEASRAGELGQGFTAVAEQVGSLAEQSTGATKTIAQIVAEIQTETQEVVAAIETGTAQVVESSKRVQTTQQQLEQVLTKSERINQLMQDISVSTTNQTTVSKAVTELMQKATQTSEQQSQSSTQVAQAIQATAKVAQELQASVEQFKVEG